MSLTESLIAVTGANGFLGSAIVAGLNARGRRARALFRSKRTVDDGVEVGDIGPMTSWRIALAGVDSVIHTAARVHIMHEKSSDALAAYRQVNVEGTRRLALQAAEAGVRRLVFVSSVKVNGERTDKTPFTALDTPAPEDAYGLSKWEAEQALHEIALRTGLEVVIIRPPLVYGPGVKANFLALVRAVARGIPLPFQAIENRRSLVAVENLVDLLMTCSDHPAAAGQTFLVSDDEDLSTPELIRRLARMMGHSPRLISMPPALLAMGASLINKRAAVQRLCGSLQVDIRRNRECLGWVPPITVDQGLATVVRWYFEHNR
jgi:nucleoside-diphosphate-sugar epimerase